MDEFVVPDWIGAAVGWRAWKIEMLTLSSVSMADKLWPSRKPMAAACYEQNPFLWVWLQKADPRECQLFAIPEETPNGKVGDPAYRSRVEYEKARPSTHDTTTWEYRLLPHSSPPCENHTCGIYAVNEPELLWGHISYNRVAGMVSLWGKTVPGDKGYRAEFAYPKELWVPCKPEDLEARTLIAELLAKEYGVPVHVGMPSAVMEAQTRFSKMDSLVAG